MKELQAKWLGNSKLGYDA